MVESISAIGAMDEENSSVQSVSYDPSLTLDVRSVKKSPEKSTIAPARKSRLSQLFNRPEVRKPSAVFEAISAHKKVTESHRESALSQKEELEDDLEKLKVLEKQMIEDLKKRCEEEASKGRWEFLTTVSTFVASAASIVLGIELISTGAGANIGYFLIASGGLGLFGEVMKAGGFEIFASFLTADKETQKKAASYMHNAMFLLSLGLGLYGLMGAAGGAGYFTTKVATTRSLAKTVAIGAVAAKTLSQCMQNYADYKIHLHEENISKNRATKTLLDNNIKELSASFQHDSQAVSNITDKMKQTIMNEPVIN